MMFYVFLTLHENNYSFLQQIRVVCPYMKITILSCSKYELFAPYAYKSNNTVRSHDLSVNYFYLDPDREWYNSVKVKDKSNITMATEEVLYRYEGYKISL